MKIRRPNRFAVITLTVLSLSLFTLFYSNDSALTKSVTALIAPGISATKTGALDTTAGGDLSGNGLVNPGDRLNYTITIPNAGPDAATDVNLSDTVDANTTLVEGSVVASPIAVNDTYSSIGNVGITVPDGASDLLSNDLDANNPGVNTALVLTHINNTAFSSGAAVTTTNGSVTVNSDGSFTYTPNAGFEGSDNFTYTLSNGTGMTDTSTVTINVSGMIWFVNSSAPAGGDGRLGTPFNCFVGAGCFSATTLDEAGDNIFLYSGNYAGGQILLVNQRLIGQGASLPLAGAGSITGVSVPSFSNALPNTGGANPVITTVVAATNAVNLGSGNTIRGLTIGNTTGAKIAGSGFGILTLGSNTAPDVTLNGTGQALNLTNGTFAASSALSSLTTTSSTGAGVSLVQIAGTVAFGGTTVTGSTTQGILVNQSTANINFGNTSITGGTDGISLQNNSAGTRTFGTIQRTNGTGVGFLHAVGGGTVSAGNVTITNPGGAGIDIQNSTTAITFANTNAAQSAGTAMNLVGNSGNFSFSDLDLSPDAGVIGLSATNNTGIITTTSGIITNSGAVAVNIAGANAGARTPLSMTLEEINSTNSSGLGVNINFVSGNLTVAGTDADVTVSNSTGIGLQIQNTGAGTINLGDTVVNSAASTSVNLVGNTGAVTFADFDIAPDAGQRALLAQNNTGTITTTSGTIAATNAVAVEITNATGTVPLNMQLTSVSASGGANGIKLSNTSSSGNPGGFRVLGSGGTCANGNTGGCSGGTIQNITGADDTSATPVGTGVALNNASNVSMTRMWIHDASNYAVRGTSIAGFTLNNSVINCTASASCTNGTNGGTDDSSVRFTELTGTANITSSYISSGFEDNFKVANTAGILNITFLSAIIGANGTAGGNDGIMAEGLGTSEVNVTVQNSTFTSAAGDLFQVSLDGTGGGDLIFSGNTLSNNHPLIATGGGGVSLFGGAAGTVTMNVSNNTFRNSVGHAVLVVKSAPPGNGACPAVAGSLDFLFHNNDIGLANVANSGSLEGAGLKIQQAACGTLTAAITDNEIRQYNNEGILIQGGAGLVYSGTMNYTLTGNIVANPGTNANISNINQGVNLNNGVTPGDNYQTCWHAKGNSVIGSGRNGGVDMRPRSRQSGTVRMPGYTGTPSNNTSAVNTFVANQNDANSNDPAANAPVPTVLSLADASSGGFQNTVGGAPCTQPVVQSIPNNIIADSGSNLDLLSSTYRMPAETQILIEPVFKQPVTSETIFNEMIAQSELTSEEFETVEAKETLALESNEAVQAKETGFWTDAAAFAGELAGKLNTTISPTVSAQESEKTRFAKEPLALKSGETVTKSLGTIPAGEQIVVRFKVTVDANIPSNDFSISNQATISGSNFGNVLTDGDAAAGIQPTVTNIVQPPSITKAFGAANIAVNGVTSLTFTITNGNVGQSYTQLAFSDTLPSGLIINTPNALISNCGGTVTATAGTNIISLSNGSLAAPATAGSTATCTIKVDVKATTDGAQNNVSGAVSSLQGGTGNTASATLNVFAAPSFSKAFGAAEIQLNNSTTLTFTINNNSASLPLTNVSFTDNLPAGLVVAATPGVTGSCGGGTITANAGAGLISLSGATMGSTSVCVISVNVTGTTVGVKNNSVSLSTAELGTGATATANVTVIEPTYAMTGTVSYGTTPVGDAAKFVPDVTMTAVGTPQVSGVTDTSGAYSLVGLGTGAYTVTPSKTGDVGGIESLDATRIQQHLVGLITLTQNQLIAADVDNNGVVNSLDAARIQQYLVQIPATSIIGQWKFVPVNRQYASISSNLSGQDYEAILVGDVSGNWTAPGSMNDNAEAREDQPSLSINTEKTGKAESIDTTTAESALQGAQINVSLPSNALASTGNTVTVPVVIGAVPAGALIESFDFSVFYDPAVLQPATPAGSNAGTLSAPCSVLVNSPTSGRVIVSGACGGSPIAAGASGTLYNLTFTVIGTANQTSALSFVNPATSVNTFNFNNGSPSAATNGGQFTVIAPTTANVTISGRAVNNQGRGIRNVLITMTDSAGNQRQAQTTTFGYYRFDNVAAGETITLTAKARRFKFVQSSIVRTTNDSVTNADFVSEQ